MAAVSVRGLPDLPPRIGMVSHDDEVAREALAMERSVVRIAPAGDRGNQFDLGKLPACHLDVNLIDRHIEKRGKHRGVLSRADGSTFVVSEA